MGTRIRENRLRMGLTQEQLGARIGVTKAAVSQWELGQSENIRPPHFLRLCAVFGTDPHYLLWGPTREDPDRFSLKSG